MLSVHWGGQGWRTGQWPPVASLLHPPQSGRPGTWLPSDATKARDLCAAVLCPGGVDGRALHFSELSWAKDGVIQGYEPLQGVCVSSAHRAPL